MAPRLTALTAMLAFALIASTAIPATITPATATAAECDQDARHDLTTAPAIETYNETGNVSSTASNTDVSLEQTSGFVRLSASNANGYCVSYDVLISSEIVSPAQLGNVESNDDSTEASWTSEQNLSSGEVFTRVEFTIPAGGNATFAPSTVRVQTLSWTGEAAREGSGIVSELKSFFGNDKLEERKYEIAPTGNTSTVTVPLDNGDKEISEWQATYSYDGRTQTVNQDASAPVFYEESSNSVTFHFSEAAAESGATVDFTAEPNALEKVQHSAQGYWSGVQESLDFIPLTVTGGIPS